MGPKDVFGVANRIIGLIVALYGLDWLARFWLGQLGYFTLQKADIGYYLILGIGYICVGAYFLRGAPHFVRFAYPDDLEAEAALDNASSMPTDKIGQADAER